MKLRWSHYVLNVRNLDEMLDFYTNVLGFEVTDRGALHPGDDAPQIVFMSQVETDHHQLAFLSNRQDEDPPNSVNHAAFRTDTLADVKGMIQKLEKDGRATGMMPLTHGNAWSIYFQDPEGNGVEVFCDTPWHVSQPQARSWDPSLSEADLLAWTKQEFGDDPEFGPIDAYYAARAKHLREG
jgi:catechol 2,3-dioxygenase